MKALHALVLVGLANLVVACGVNSTEDGDDPDGTETDFKYGESAQYSSTPGSSDVSLEVTVEAPEDFEVGEDAIVFDYREEFVSGKAGALQDDNVYFEVTIKNVSKDGDEVYKNAFVMPAISNFGGGKASNVYEDDVDGVDVAGLELKPGDFVTWKDGYSVKDASDITYEIRFDGLAGDTLSFTD